MAQEDISKRQKLGDGVAALDWLAQCETAITKCEQIDICVNLNTIYARATIETDPDVAYEYAHEAFRTAEQARFPWGKTEALFERGRAAIALGQSEDANNDGDACLRIAQCLPYPILQGRALIQLGIIARDHEQYQEAREYWYRAADVLEKMPVTERQQVRELLSELCKQDHS